MRCLLSAASEPHRLPACMLSNKQLIHYLLNNMRLHCRRYDLPTDKYQLTFWWRLLYGFNISAIVHNTSNFADIT